MITTAPELFIIIAVLIWIVLRWQYKARIDTLNDRLALAKDLIEASTADIDRLKDELATLKSEFNTWASSSQINTTILNISNKVTNISNSNNQIKYVLTGETGTYVSTGNEAALRADEKDSK